VHHGGLVRNPIDAFVLAKLEAKGLSFSAEAAKLTLIRRATFDLTGMPPEPAEVKAFLADQSPNAYEKLIDRLLASPRYGEHWARYWLDAAGYADSEGGKMTSDDPRPLAWRYRDYVIRSLNADKPYDRFLLEQIAGRLLPYIDPDATPYQLLARAQQRDEHNTEIEQQVAALKSALESKAEPIKKKILDQRLSKLPKGIEGDLREIAAIAPDKRTEVQKYLAQKFETVLRIEPADLMAADPYIARRPTTQAGTLGPWRRSWSPKTRSEHSGIEVSRLPLTF
jgi:hypothetical protein